MSYMTIFSQEKHHFSLCSYFHAHPTTLLLKILGGTNAWAVPPTSNFGGDRPPQSRPRAPPLVLVTLSSSLSLRTYFKSLSLSWSLGVRSLSLSWSLGVRSLSLSWSL